MKTQKRTAMVGILAVFSLVFIVCDNDNDTPKTYTVTFNTDKGAFYEK